MSGQSRCPGVWPTPIALRHLRERASAAFIAASVYDQPGIRRHASRENLDSGLYGCCSTGTRSGAWRGLDAKGAGGSRRNRPLAENPQSSPGSGLSLFQISCATRQDPSGCLHHVTRYFPASWIDSPSAFGVRLIT